MTYYNAKDLAAAFRTVRKNTIQVAQDIPEDKYSFVPAPGTKTVAAMLAHVGASTRFQDMVHRERRTSFDGMDFAKLFEEYSAYENKPRTKAELIELLTREGEAFASWLEGLNDEFLAEHVEMMPGATPPTKTRFEMLMSVKEHEMHHRAQLMLIERMLGITPHLTRVMEERMAARAART
jgi:uncharacterized damage-inducible protein DinB